MNIQAILDPLNDAQREAVTSPAASTLVLAGAGSGKTRVLTHRIAWLVQAMGVSPYAILAMTFTNKAAAEMRGRVEHLLDRGASGMWLGTFHSIAHRLLRTHWLEAGLPQAFQILDSDDQLRLVKRLLRERGLEETRWPPRMVAGYINGKKEEGLRPAAVQPGYDPASKQLLELYAAYETLCRQSGLVDFAELLLRALEVVRDTPALLDHYRQRFTHLLVDEFQDTNALQYGWLRLLAGSSGSIFAVGDDDQSIYGWRGAKVEHIRHFERDFPATHVVRLEQNYRSTATILKAANAVIAHNAERLGKNLWTDGVEGEPIQVYAAYNEQDEARFVAERISAWRDAGHALTDVAFCTAPTPNRACWKKPSSSMNCPTASTAACASSNAPKSRTCSPTSTSRATATMTRPLSVWSMCRRVASATKPWNRCATRRGKAANRCGKPPCSCSPTANFPAVQQARCVPLCWRLMP